jgi:hypothetical protein
VVVTGMLILALESVRSPRSIRGRRWVACALAPIPLAQIWLWVASPLAKWPNLPTRAGWSIAGIAIAVLIVAAQRHSHQLLRTSLTIATIAAGTLTVAETSRTVMFANDDDPLLALASGLTLVGGLLIATGLMRTQVELAS